MEYVVIAVVVVVAFFAGGVMLRPAPPTPAPPKPFGLTAFQTQGLGERGEDAIAAAKAVVTFLGHPFTVVEDAKDAMSRAYTREAQDRRQIAENMKEIAELQDANNSLGSDALAALARANQMEALIERVNSVVGS